MFKSRSAFPRWDVEPSYYSKICKYQSEWVMSEWVHISLMIDLKYYKGFPSYHAKALYPFYIWHPTIGKICKNVKVSEWGVSEYIYFMNSYLRNAIKNFMFKSRSAFPRDVEPSYYREIFQISSEWGVSEYIYFWWWIWRNDMKDLLFKSRHKHSSMLVLDILLWWNLKIWESEWVRSEWVYIFLMMDLKKEGKGCYVQVKTHTLEMLVGHPTMGKSITYKVRE